MENSRNCRMPSRAGHSIVDYFFGSSHLIQITPRYISGWWFEPLWKIWVRQLGWWNSQYGTNNPAMLQSAPISIINYRSIKSILRYIKSILRYIKSSFIYIYISLYSYISDIMYRLWPFPTFFAGWSLHWWPLHANTPATANPMVPTPYARHQR